MNIQHFVTETPEALLARHRYNMVDLEFMDGSKSSIKDVELIFLRMIWQPLLDYGILPGIEDVHSLIPFTTDTISNIHSKLYVKYLNACSEFDNHMKFILSCVCSVENVQNFSLNNLSSYVSSISQLDICDLVAHPAIQKIRNKKFNSAHGTRAWEAFFEEASKVVMDLVASDELPNNPFRVMAQTGVLKGNQIPQGVLSYGPRSDINDTVYNTVVRGCASSGVQNTEEFAIEQLSAKKSSYFNNEVIRRTQYFARLLRIVSFTRPYIYKGSCNTEKLTKLVIVKGTEKNYIDINVKTADGTWHILTHDNVKQFVNIPLEKHSPINCAHEHGVCETCFGRINSSAYFPIGMHIGMLSGTQVGAKISQMILSAKHLIKTISKAFNMEGLGSKWVKDVLKAIKLSTDIPADILENGYIGVPLQSMGPLTDLVYTNDFMCKNYSSVSEMGFYDSNLNELCFVSFGDNTKLPNLSLEFLEHTKDHLEDVKSDGNTVYLPIKGFLAKILDYQVVNDDMVGFTERVTTFLRTGIADYTNYNDILKDFTELIYSKTNVNIRYVEVLLRMFAINKVGYELPVSQDSNDVKVLGINHRVSVAPITSKICHQELMKYLKAPETYLYPKPSGLYDPLFGLNLETMEERGITK